MTIIEATRTTALSTRFSWRLVAFISAAFEAIAEWNDARATRKELYKLSEHELNDIGLCRGDIANIAR